jgi:hypothetical protein
MAFISQKNIHRNGSKKQKKRKKKPVPADHGLAGPNEKDLWGLNGASPSGKVAIEG